MVKSCDLPCDEDSFGLRNYCYLARMGSFQYKGLDKQSKKRGKLRTFCCSKCSLIAMGVVGVVILVVAGLIVGFAASNPIHASCKVNWVFPSMSCDNVRTKIKNQITLWSGRENCKNGGEKCLYAVGTDTGKTLTATHTTPVKEYVDKMTFTFTDASPDCHTEGYSTSETWYAVLDYGTNYCNLHNLITGSGLNNTVGYKEMTSDSQCTQYSSADCEKY